MHQIIRILYVDDSPHDRALVHDALMLDHTGFSLITATSHEEFEAHLAEGGYDLILSDFNILGYEGLQVLDRVRELTPHIPVVIVTGTGSEEIAAEAMKRGAFDYVIKTPNHIQRLPFTVHTVLERKHLQEEHKRAYEALRASEERFHHLAEVSPVGIFTADVQGGCQYVNQRWCDIAGMSPQQAYGAGWMSTLHPDDYQRVIHEWHHAAKNCVPFKSEYRFRNPQGIVTWVIGQAVIERTTAGSVKGYIGTITDITEHKRAEQALQISEQRFRSLIENSADAIALFDAEGIILYGSPATARILGYEQSEFVGRSAFDFVHPDDREMVMSRLNEVLQKPAAMINVRAYIKHKDGSWRFLEGIFNNLLDEPSVRAIVNNYRDITDARRYQEQLEYQANHDMLTGLSNRNLLYDRLDQAIVYAQRYKRLVAVVLIDLDNFKIINDSLGHNVGDQLVKAVATRLRECVRKGDTVARQGGDEFVLVLNDQENLPAVTHVMQKILNIISRVYVVEDREIYITCSIGFSLYPQDGLDVETLLKNADAAMYRAKEHGRNNFQFFTPEMNAKINERLTLESSLRQALERNEFFLHYQPLVDLHSGRIISAEALVRWKHPELGVISPAKFIPLAEETGLIVSIGAWVLKTACAQNKAWQEAGLYAINVSVNLSARQFRQKDLVNSIAQALKDARLDARYLELELTESVIMHNAEEVIDTLRELKSMGIHLSIDDFGMGYSSLSYLKRFPVDRLKIDQSFVRDITFDPDDAAIAQAVITLAHSLDLRVIAEGVETEAQLNFLRAHCCDEIQGYYFSRPVPAEAFGELLRNNQSLQPAGV